MLRQRGPTGRAHVADIACGARGVRRMRPARLGRTVPRETICSSCAAMVLGPTASGVACAGGADAAGRAAIGGRAAAGGWAAPGGGPARNAAANLGAAWGSGSPGLTGGGAAIRAHCCKLDHRLLQLRRHQLRRAVRNDSRVHDDHDQPDDRSPGIHGSRTITAERESPKSNASTGAVLGSVNASAASRTALCSSGPMELSLSHSISPASSCREMAWVRLGSTAARTF